MSWRTFDLLRGSMGPKVEAACGFVTVTGNNAAIARRSLGRVAETPRRDYSVWVSQ